MKVNAWKNIDVEFEADVSLDDCINEMLDIANSEDGYHRKLMAINGATKIMERINPDLLGDRLCGNTEGLRLVRDRLAKWVALCDKVLKGGT